SPGANGALAAPLAPCICTLSTISTSSTSTVSTISTSSTFSTCSCTSGSHGRPQPPERGQHLGVAEVRVAAARVGQHEHARALDGLGLDPDAQLFTIRGVRPQTEGSIERHPYKRDDPRLELLDLAFEDAPSFQILGRLEVVDAGTRTRDQVRDAESPLGQPPVIAIADRLRHEAGLL